MVGVEEVAVSSGTIRLDQFLKWAGIVGTGGQAKILITGGRVKVNGQVEVRRGRRLRPGDRVQVDHLVYQVVSREG